MQINYKKLLTATFMFFSLQSNFTHSIAIAKPLKSNLDTLQFDGKINAASADKLLYFLKHKGKTIIINSEGGDAMVSLKIAKELSSSDTEVIVDKYCLSSCANYLFIGARKKSLRPGAILGFHGGITYNKEDAMKIKDKKFASFYKANDDFFRKIGTDVQLFIASYELTKLPEPKLIFTIRENKKNRNFDSQSEATNALDACFEKKLKCGISVAMQSTSNIKAYFPSLATLKKYGVAGIDDYPYPEDQSEMDKIAAFLQSEFELVGDFPSAP